MFEECLLSKDNTVKDAIGLLEGKSIRSVFIVDSDMHLEGIFTRGDLRQYMLSSNDLNVPLADVMNRNPITFHSVKAANAYSQKQKLVVYPIVSREKKLTDVIYNTWDVIAEASESKCLEDVPLVIMAGGLGTRLYPLTKILPKALIPIGDLTITERIIHNFEIWGCKEVYLILNHKADMIKAYFNELEKDYNVHYLQEEKFLGTGGGLSLLKGFIQKTFILTNCDVLVNADFDCVMKTHYHNGNVITFVGAMKNIPIPYGIIDTNAQGESTGLREKPDVSFLTNTGVYVCEPNVIKELDENCFCHITDIAQKYMDQGNKVGVFPVTENVWLDMGQFKEMKDMMNALGIEE